MAVNLWRPEYMLDIQTIDDQHKAFFDICSKLGELCEHAKKGDELDSAAIIQNIFRLRRYAFFHFHTEEKLMAKHAYAGSLAHFMTHDKYLMDLQRFTNALSEFSDGPDENAQQLLQLAEKLSDWAADWWGEHILEHDKEYADALR